MPSENLNKSRRSIKYLEKVAVVGLGYVGLPLALLASSRGYTTYGIEIDKQKRELLERHISPIRDQKIKESLRKSKVKITEDFGVISKVSVVIICVPTPVDDNFHPNLDFIKTAATSIARNLRKNTLIVLESTVYPGVSENVIIPILEKGSGLKLNQDFYVAHCPERINPGNSKLSNKWGIHNINRVVGASNDIGLKRAVDFYRTIIDADIKPMNNIKEAEAVKIVENSFRDINIAFVNELARSFDNIGIDIVNVIDGASTKPFSFMAHYPGVGVGGHCIPVDPYYLIEYGKGYGFNHHLLSTARQINHDMPEYTANLVIQMLNQLNMTVKDTRILVLGLAYKGDIDDFRETPSLPLIGSLIEMGAIVNVYDPLVDSATSIVKSHIQKFIGNGPINKESLDKSFDDIKIINEAIALNQIVVIATNHEIFTSLEPYSLNRLGIKGVVDGRNCLNKLLFTTDSGVAYKGIGR